MRGAAARQRGRGRGQQPGAAGGGGSAASAGAGVPAGHEDRAGMEVDEASDASGMSGLSEPEEEEVALVVDDAPFSTGLPAALGATGLVFGEAQVAQPAAPTAPLVAVGGSASGGAPMFSGGALVTPSAVVGNVTPILSQGTATGLPLQEPLLLPQAASLFSGGGSPNVGEPSRVSTGAVMPALGHGGGSLGGGGHHLAEETSDHQHLP